MLCVMVVFSSIRGPSPVEAEVYSARLRCRVSSACVSRRDLAGGDGGDGGDGVGVTVCGAGDVMVRRGLSDGAMVTLTVGRVPHGGEDHGGFSKGDHMQKPDDLLNYKESPPRTCTAGSTSARGTPHHGQKTDVGLLLM